MNNIFSFPQSLQFKIGTVIDDVVKQFSRDYKEILDAIRSVAIEGVQGINWLLTSIPWFILILLVIFLGYKVSKKIKVGLLYGALLFFIGSAGMWEHMIETVSIVTAAVIISLVLGFPLGILIAMSKRAESIIRPILDLMQTMPAFVYLVPAVMLFNLGIMPALLATIIYSIVPMIRLTSHGIMYVDKEVKEAAIAFGSTKIQALIKVQIPQAIPTIMTGVNQTIMMAMSMVVTCAIIGAEGLGLDILIATNRVEMGKALLPGIAIVIIAIIFDRLTQGFIKKKEVSD
ncbi:ABC transporter permease [Sedimentibacter sp. MB31-C6]|uniref:ABC transporter permease n=1 Tax=Sedimentibacter sp. MB31-C6 TaxID=3109366 RepID=UPI002DDD2124|nr:ABC transporter permease subunit [Sedimentibacter sp. MB36-C1]WSI02910.1 ABC transporter permease subunit [Sedimentibacter sp. MB36-C1]